MTKYLLLGAATALVFLNSCTEKGPSIDFSQVKAVDTAYIGPVAAPQSRNVLVEEFTGVQCTNCPAGTLVLNAAEDANPGRVIVVSLHGGSLTAPLPGHSKLTLASDQALNLV